MPDLVCPKCQSPMRSYERNGVTVDQCTGCRGVFLDRGELERLVDAEGAYYERADTPAPEPRREERPREHEQHRDRDDWRPGYGHSHGKRKKKKSFLDDVFDFG
ncbi:MAG TPA: zf-TFIIB domain-containing protein [Solirubrobacteraceae bacterium]|nr:zf-TFIIB domain-containing protein [Solirubrobacteraceae bacterium]